ncbi:hypothetical protein K438DRAFT_1761662 [Mycena galopus ATCC 62051]|nr:hypothetical protein K438DRAFT_1761662 [Mycena galopus ATCC 62051]
MGTRGYNAECEVRIRTGVLATEVSSTPHGLASNKVCNYEARSGHAHEKEAGRPTVYIVEICESSPSLPGATSGGVRTGEARVCGQRWNRQCQPRGKIKTEEKDGGNGQMKGDEEVEKGGRKGRKEGRGKGKDGENQRTDDARTNRSRQPYLRYYGVEELRRTGLQSLLSASAKAGSTDRYGSLRKPGPSLQKDPDFADASPIRNTRKKSCRTQDLRGDKSAARKGRYEGTEM